MMVSGTRRRRHTRGLTSSNSIFSCHDHEALRGSAAAALLAIELPSWFGLRAPSAYHSRNGRTFQTAMRVFEDYRSSSAESAFDALFRRARLQMPAITAKPAATSAGMRLLPAPIDNNAASKVAPSV